MRWIPRSLLRGSSFEVVGIPLNGNQDKDIPPFPFPRSLLENPEEICKFLLATPLEMLKPHLEPQILPEETGPDAS